MNVSIVRTGEHGTADRVAGVYRSWRAAQLEGVRAMIRIALRSACGEPDAWLCVASEPGFERWHLEACVVEVTTHAVNDDVEHADTLPPISFG